MLNLLKIVVLSSCITAFSVNAADTETLDKTNNRLTEISGVMQSINEELNSQRSNIRALKSRIDADQKEDKAFRNSVLRELRQLRRQNETLTYTLMKDKNKASASNKEGTVISQGSSSNSTPDGKMIFGEDEFIYVKEANAYIDARIDTGAAVSSISATDITEFERNGKKWYRFTLSANDRFIEMEAPHVRYSEIRQSSKNTTTKRPVVSLNVKIGDYSTSSEFTLTDRSNMQYSLLIGRTFIQDIAVVDVSRQHIFERENNVLVLLNRDAYNAAKDKGINPNAEYDKQNINESAGKIAYPADNGANLGDDAGKALPPVIDKLNTAQKEK